VSPQDKTGQNKHW